MSDYAPHQFKGKESGHMVIGSVTEIRMLGEQLQALTAENSNFSDKNWPPLVVSTLINRASDYSLSFHIETKIGNCPPSNMPQSETRKTIFFILSIVGFISLVRLGLTYIF
ncbi:hypothetical protein [Methylomonas sp. AM2-LC]|uniref:hypothetical protein n=1 Tax=Methylomonas sp. AM2-LC TaxID=3153301 RepID=UPI0032648BFA